MSMGKTLNGNIMCSVAIRTTGKDIEKDDIYHICVLPLDLNYNPIFGQVFDRYVQVRLENESKLKDRDRVFARRHSTVWDQFDLWFEDNIKKGQIIPLVYDWPLTSRFLTNFFSPAGFEIAFCDKARDLKVIANYMNDLHEEDKRHVPFAKTTLRYILNNCEYPLDREYNALNQAMLMSRAYKKMLRFPF